MHHTLTAAAGVVIRPRAVSGIRRRAYTPRPELSYRPLCRAELVAFGVLHDPPVPGRSLVDFADPGCPQVFQPDHQIVEAARFTVDVDVQAVLAGFALGHVLEQQPP